MSSTSPLTPAGKAPLVSPKEMTQSGLCIGCGTCVAGTGGAMKWDRYGQLKPRGPPAWLRTRDETFARTCPFSPHAPDEDRLAAQLFPSARHRDPLVGRFEAAYVGHVAEADFRLSGSSGGLTSWVAAELLRQGLVDGVAHVVPADPVTEGRLFRYRVSRSEAELCEGAKSRYYPIELSGVIETIRAVPGRYAVVGIPCFIKAINLLRAEEPAIRQRVAYTLGLFCGHMKSARMVESFAWQMGVDPEEVRAIDYRLKNADRPANWYTADITLSDGRRVQQDWWHLVDGDWGSGFFQNSACDFCDDVVAETADISFGDAWVEPYSSDGRGTNVVIVRSRSMLRIVQAGIDEGHLALEPVDAAFIERTQSAGLRHRREGLAWRLDRPRRGIRPLKRVAPGASGLSVRRKLVYRMRRHIARWSHRFFWLARRLRWPGLYVRWARIAVTLYHALTYSRGRLGRVVDRLPIGR